MMEAEGRETNADSSTAWQPVARFFLHRDLGSRPCEDGHLLDSIRLAPRSASIDDADYVPGCIEAIPKPEPGSCHARQRNKRSAQDRSEAAPRSAFVTAKRRYCMIKKCRARWPWTVANEQAPTHVRAGARSMAIVEGSDHRFTVANHAFEELGQ